MINTYYSLIRFIKDIPWKLRQIKFFYQRGKRGWADCDCWAIDSYLISIILPMLKELKKNHQGHPGDVTDEEWTNILSEMIAGFEAADRVLEDDYLDTIQPGWFEEMEKIPDLNNKLSSKVITKKTMRIHASMYKKDIKLFKSKMPLFTKYFFGLWD